LTLLEILKFWRYYTKTHKSVSEKKVIQKIDKVIKYSIKKQRVIDYMKSIRRIQRLINYETKLAYMERKKFLVSYDKMKQKLYYIIGFIIGITFLLVILILFLNIKKYKNLEYLTKKYKLESITDGMTKLYNKKFFNELLDYRVKPFATNNNAFVAFIMFDIDNFKKYNDTYGHDKGDDTLIAVANVLKQTLNKSNCFVFRLGGEEFGALIFDINRVDLKKILEILRLKVRNLYIKHEQNPPHNVVTVSSGATIVKPYEQRNSRDIYISADKMLYKSKESGRNCWFIDDE